MKILSICEKSRLLTLFANAIILFIVFVEWLYFHAKKYVLKAYYRSTYPLWRV